MNIHQLNDFPEHLKNDISDADNAAPKCPFAEGKLVLSKYKSYTLDAAKAIIDKLGFNIWEQTTYWELLDQNNKEKELQYSLTHDMVKAWMDVGYPYYMDTIKEEKVGIEHVRKIASMRPEMLKLNIMTCFNKINRYIKSEHADIAKECEEYDEAKILLAKNGVRKSVNSKTLWIDQLKDEPIVTQLMANMIPYMQYLYLSNEDNPDFTIDLKNVKAPKNWFFSGNFGGPLRGVFINTMHKYYEDWRTNELYDETQKYWISTEAMKELEELLKNPSEKQKEKTEEEWKEDETESNWEFMLAEEAIYGCPVSDSFTKFYRLVLASCLE